MLMSQGVGKLQWWLLSFLLGPTVCRRIVSSAQPYLMSPLSAKAWRREMRRRRRSVGSEATENLDSCMCGAREEQERQRNLENGVLGRHSPWLWIKFSLTLAFAIGAAIKEGPGTILRAEWTGRERCVCGEVAAVESTEENEDVVVDGHGDAAASDEIPAVANLLEIVDPEPNKNLLQVVELLDTRPGMHRVASQRSLADELEDAGFDDEDEHEHYE